MADETPKAVEQTNPLDAGHTTSEHKLTLILMSVGAVLEAGAVVVKAAHEMFPNATWLTVAMMAIGGLMQVVGVIKQVNSRTEIKTAKIEAEASIKNTADAIEFLKKGPTP